MNATTLKILGIIAMTIDHIGFFLFPQITILRVIGRLTYPIFAYMIAEGCSHTRNKVRYLCTMLGVGCICSAVTYFAGGSLYQSVFTTFSCSIILIIVLENAMRARESAQRICRFCIAAVITFLFFITFRIGVIPGFETDYGFFGIITPVLVWLGNSKAEKLMGLAAGLCFISMELGAIQWCSLAAIVFLYLYNGERGKHSLKWFFYGYYPLHIAVLYGMAQFIL